MNQHRRSVFSFLIVALLSCLVAIGVSAQSNGTLALGQPLPNQVAAGGQLDYDLSISQTSQVTIQALSDSAQPTLTILRGGEVVAAQPNAEGVFTTSLSALLSTGTYTVQVGTANNTAGLVIVLLQSQAPVTAETLTPSFPLSGVVGPQSPLALYTFTALFEPAFLYVDGESAEEGVSVRLVNTTSGQTSGEVAANLLGVRFRIPPGTDSYQVEVQGSEIAEPFTICLAAVSSIGGCEFSAAPQPATAVVVPTLQATAIAVCTVSTANNGGVNIRQSASTTSLIIGRLPDGVSATVTGISPDGTFYNVIYNNQDGWIATSVVVTSGNCATVPPVMPPPIIPQPTAVPPTAVPPTLPPPPPTQSGPCLITINSPVNVYSAPTGVIDDLFDQVQGGELIPIGRLADNSWWKTNYANAWIRTSEFGNTVSVSGDCSALPIVAAP